MDAYRTVKLPAKLLGIRAKDAYIASVVYVLNLFTCIDDLLLRYDCRLHRHISAYSLIHIV